MPNNGSGAILPIGLRATSDDDLSFGGGAGGGSQAGSTRVLPQSQSFSASPGVGSSGIVAAIGGTGSGRQQRAPIAGSTLPDYAFAVTTASSFASEPGIEAGTGSGGDGTGHSNSPSEQGDGSDGSFVGSELDANGWGSGRSQQGGGGPGGLGALTGSYRERNSDRMLARAKYAGRPANPRRSQVPSAIAAAAHDNENESSRGIPLRTDS